MPDSCASSSPHLGHSAQQHHIDRTPQHSALGASSSCRLELKRGPERIDQKRSGISTSCRSSNSIIVRLRLCSRDPIGTLSILWLVLQAITSFYRFICIATPLLHQLYGPGFVSPLFMPSWRHNKVLHTVVALQPTLHLSLLVLLLSILATHHQPTSCFLSDNSIMSLGSAHLNHNDLSYCPCSQGQCPSANSCSKLAILRVGSCWLVVALLLGHALDLGSALITSSSASLIYVQPVFGLDLNIASLGRVSIDLVSLLITLGTEACLVVCACIMADPILQALTLPIAHLPYLT